MIAVELAYKAKKIKLNVAKGISVKDALANNNLYQSYLTEVSTPHLGIFGKEVTPEYILKEHDRIELYFPLLCDPMEKRKNKIKKSASSPALREKMLRSDR